jgi:hypothetical protein
MTDMDPARIESLVERLKVELPKLVTIAFTQLKADLPRIVPGLSDAEWEKLVREESRRRATGEGRAP